MLGTTTAGYGTVPYNWLCDTRGQAHHLAAESCHEQALRYAKNGNLTLLEYGWPKAQRCYSRRKPERCKFGFSVILGVFVSVFNPVKLVLCIVTLCAMRRHVGTDDLLISIDNAIKSFICLPDEPTRRICMAERSDFENGLWNAR